MQPEDVKAEIATLEIQLHHLDMQLDKAIESNAGLAKIKIIYHDMKLIADRIEQFKKINVGK